MPDSKILHLLVGQRDSTIRNGYRGGHRGGHREAHVVSAYPGIKISRMERNVFLV